MTPKLTQGQGQLRLNKVKPQSSQSGWSRKQSGRKQSKLNEKSYYSRIWTRTSAAAGKEGQVCYRLRSTN